MDPINAHEGWFVSHLFFEVDRLLWDSLSEEERSERKETFLQRFESFRRRENCQINAYSVWGLKADLGLMLKCFWKLVLKTCTKKSIMN